MLINAGPGHLNAGPGHQASVSRLKLSGGFRKAAVQLTEGYIFSRHMKALDTKKLIRNMTGAESYLITSRNLMRVSKCKQK